jgi:TonB family protein
MKYPILLTAGLSFLMAGAVHAQRDTLASFPGGDAALNRFIAGNLMTTREAQQQRIQGDIECSFTVDASGAITEVKTLNKRLGYGLEDQAMRVFRIMPRWQPGVIEGRRIKSTFQQTLHFTPDMKINDVSTAISRDMVPDADCQFGKTPGDLSTWITENYKYPAGAPSSISDAITLRFKINEEGTVTDIRIVSGVSREFDKEAIRLLQSMPRWQPKQVNFKTVGTYKDLAIGFSKKKALLL